MERGRTVQDDVFVHVRRRVTRSSSRGVLGHRDTGSRKVCNGGKGGSDVSVVCRESA